MRYIFVLLFIAGINHLLQYLAGTDAYFGATHASMQESTAESIESSPPASNSNRERGPSSPPNKKESKKHHAQDQPGIKLNNAPNERKQTCLHLPQLLGQTPLAKLPRIEQALLREIDVLHIRGVRGRCPTNPRGDHDRVSLEDDSVVDDFVNGQGDEVVVLHDGALVGGAPVFGGLVRGNGNKEEGHT